MTTKTYREEFQRLCYSVEPAEAVEKMFARALAKGIHPRLVAGVKWGLFPSRKEMRSLRPNSGQSPTATPTDNGEIIPRVRSVTNPLKQPIRSKNCWRKKTETFGVVGELLGGILGRSLPKHFARWPTSSTPCPTS